MPTATAWRTSGRTASAGTPREAPAPNHST
jgi:hypothetical protein